MTLRKGHGNGAGQPRIEVMPVDELPDPIPLQAPPLQRAEKGKIKDSATAKELGRRGGLARQHKLRFIAALGLKKLPDEAELTPYIRNGEGWLKVKSAELAAIAGGNVGVGVSSILSTAARQYVASIYLFDLGTEIGGVSGANLMHKAGILGNDARQNLLAAHELAIKEGKLRAEMAQAGLNPFEAIFSSADEAGPELGDDPDTQGSLRADDSDPSPKS